jgi:hypothetical protein
MGDSYELVRALESVVKAEPPVCRLDILFGEVLGLEMPPCG